MVHKTFKKLQKATTKAIAKANQIIEQDELWLGRFYCTQSDPVYYPNEQLFTCNLRFYDRQSDYYWDRQFAIYNWTDDTIGREIKFIMLLFNTFIVEKIDVRLREIVPINYVGLPKITHDNRERNYFLDKKYFDQKENEL